MTTLADAHLYRRGVKTALASWEAYARGVPAAEVRRARVQATEVAERVHAAVGFRDLGPILEYVP